MDYQWILIIVVISRAYAQTDQICCESTGDCYTNDPPFDGTNWPLPQCLEPTFTLYRKDVSGGIEGVAIQSDDTPPEYVPSDPTIYLVHGLLDFSPGWAEIMKEEFFMNQTIYNVVVVDWLEGARMDPTGPNFDTPGCAAQAENCRLHPSDAPQVDNIHTDASGLVSGGTFTPMGHMDFYPNGGVADQPGCENSTSLELCSHGYAIDLFTASINNDCFIVTQNCTDAMDLLNSCGPCDNEGCPNMGAGASGVAEGIFYLETEAEYPYCS